MAGGTRKWVGQWAKRWGLFKDDEFPRSFMHCINSVEESLGTLDNNRPCLLAVRKVVNQLERARVETLQPDDLVVLVDDLQHGLVDIHATIARMYFLPPPGS